MVENIMKNIEITFFIFGGSLISVQLISILTDNFKDIKKICKSDKKTTIIIGVAFDS